MPIYSYHCQDCGEKFERFRGVFDSDKEVACPKCGKKDPRRGIVPVCGGSAGSFKGNLRFPT
jgi:putative FmdB family regulatory protein